MEDQKNNNLYYSTIDWKIHLHPTSFTSLQDATPYINALRALQNIINVTLRNPFTGEELYFWDLFQGCRRF